MEIEKDSFYEDINKLAEEIKEKQDGKHNSDKS